MRKIIIISALTFIVNIAYSQKYIKFYKKGVKFYNEKKYREADSLFSIALEKISDFDNGSNIYFDRAITRLYLKDTCGYCNDMKTASEYNDEEALTYYKKYCLDFNEKASKYYKQGIYEFKQKNYKKSDSLLTLSIDSYEFVDNILLRGLVKLYILDTNSFCSDMAKIYSLNDQAKENYQKICRKTTNKSIGYVQQPCPCMNKKDEEDEKQYEEGFGDEVFFVVEKMPEFNGKKSSEFRFFVQENLTYPIEAQELGITGRVFVQFDICKNGELRNAVIVKSLNESLDNEVLRILSLSPKWSPGMQRNETVIVRFTFPVIFLSN